MFEHVKGVTDVVSGYAGGSASDANYDEVSSEGTGHAEAVKITYDPSQVSYAQLLQIYFTVAHDPTAGEPAGAGQRPELSLGDLPADRRSRRISPGRSSPGSTPRTSYKAPIATKIESGGFYPAEAYHQDFARQAPLLSRTSSSTTGPRSLRCRSKFPAFYKA